MPVIQNMHISQMRTYLYYLWGKKIKLVPKSTKGLPLLTFNQNWGNTFNIYFFSPVGFYVNVFTAKDDWNFILKRIKIVHFKLAQSHMLRFFLKKNTFFLKNKFLRMKECIGNQNPSLVLNKALISGAAPQKGR